MHYLSIHLAILGSLAVFALLATVEGFVLLTTKRIKLLRREWIGSHIVGLGSRSRFSGRSMMNRELPQDGKRRLRPMRPAIPRGPRRHRMPRMTREVFQGRGAKRVLPAGELLRSWRE